VEWLLWLKLIRGPGYRQRIDDVEVKDTRDSGAAHQMRSGINV
jgi:hypothetical protein